MEELRKEPVTAGLILLNILVFLIVEFTGSSQNTMHMLDWGAAYTPMIIQGGEYYRLFTCMFLHFGIEHLLNNMLVLFVLGSRLEQAIGRIRFLLIYLLGGVLGNVISSIPEKTSTAIVGPSGSGKTTICSLLARFYDVNSGSISVGGHDIRELTCDSLLSNISMVFQNVYLFHDTIRANICFGNPDASEQDMINAAKKACCHEFIMELPDGYDTVIGEGGNTLSGGQKQRISIARAILKDSPIIILDEATASIDPENEHLIQNAITELTRGKTIITIAHRLSTIEQADQILVVDDGRIAECGTHEELLRQNGKYRQFVKIREKAEGWKIS